MRDSLSPIQNSPVITCNDGVGSDNGDTLPIRSVSGCTQSPHAPSVGCHDSVNWEESYRALQSVFSGARACSTMEILVATSACLEAPYTTPAQAVAEVADVRPMPQDMNISAEIRSLESYFDPIQGLHFQKWADYNTECHSRLEAGGHAPPEMDVRALWEMMNDAHGNAASADTPSGSYREQVFARKYNINPLAWSVTVMLNRNPVTFLPREDHRIVAQTKKPEQYTPITVLDVKAWQHYVKNQRDPIRRAMFAKDRNLSPDTFAKVVGTYGALGMYAQDHRGEMKVMPELFINPKLLGINNNGFSQPITAKHLKDWELAKMDKDYGIMFYLCQARKWRNDLGKDVHLLRNGPEKGAVLTVAFFAKRNSIGLDTSQKMITDIENWHRMSVLQRLGYMMGEFASKHSLDELGWFFFVCSNELAILSSFAKHDKLPILRAFARDHKQATLSSLVSEISLLQQFQEMEKERRTLCEKLKMRIQKVIEYRWPQYGP